MKSITQLTVLKNVLILSVFILAGANGSYSALPNAVEATSPFPQESKTASAEASGPTSVTLDAIRPFEEADGYTYVEATMHGNVERDDGSTGAYAVPIILIYPHDGGNGVGVVDWVNNVSLGLGGFSAAADEWAPGQLALAVTDGYLFESGYTYAGVQWDKAVTEYFGSSAPNGGEEHNHLIYGTIELTEDAFDIFHHAANFLRDPDTVEGAGILRPVDAVLSFGFSQTGIMQMTFLSRGKNLQNGELVYDGHIIGKMGLICAKIHNEPPSYADSEPCTDLPVEDGSRVIAVQAQSDVEAVGAGYSRFPNNPNWRQYELAGVSHIPMPIFPGLDENQNPANSQQVFRAAFFNLANWILDGVDAPPSKFLKGTLNADGTFDTVHDEDGNALDGLRLPHMEQVIDGTAAGAPLGVYTGIHPDADPDFILDLDLGIELLRLIAGYFEPFTDEEIAERYPDRETYLQRVSRAADYLLEAGYILEQDRDAYVNKAARNPIGSN